jgi:hypothetical protein
MAMDMFGNRVARAQRRRQYEPDLALLHHVRCPVALACLGARVRYQRHAKSRAVKIRRLPRIADVELNVVGPAQGKKINLVCQWFGDGLGL